MRKTMATPKVLLIGDSIRISYQDNVKQLLGNSAEIVGVEKNCLDTKNTLENFETAITSLEPDLVHWNNGLHDVKRSPECDDCQVPADQYRENIEKLLEKFRKLFGEKIIWATTTPVIEQRHNAKKPFKRFNADIDKYNTIAGDIMERNGIAVDDLHAVISRDPENLIVQDGVHLNETGQQQTGQAVADAIRKML